MSLLKRLETEYPTLSRAHRRIVDCLRNEATTWELLRQEDLARAAGVSLPTLVRFVRQQGYAGFAEFREDLKSCCQALGIPQRLLDAPREAAGIVSKVASLDQANLQSMFGSLDESRLSEAVNLLTRARQRQFLGRGVSQIMAEMLAYQLSQAGLTCTVTGPADFSTQVANLTEADLLVLFSFRPYARETVDAAAFARELGVPILGFSDSETSPLAKLADTHLLVPCENILFSHSFTTFAVLSHALASSVAHQDRALTVNRLKAAELVTRPLFLPDPE